MAKLVYYDYQGEAVVYTDDGENLYRFDGTPVAYFYNDSVYSFRGKYLGYAKNGWICDRNGLAAFFSTSARGGPVKPVRRVAPVASVKRVRPVKSVRQVRPVRAVRKSSWSPLSGAQFFD